MKKRGKNVINTWDLYLEHRRARRQLSKLLRTTKEETLVKGYPSVKNIQEFHCVLSRGQPNKTLCKYSRWKGVKEARGWPSQSGCVIGRRRVMWHNNKAVPAGWVNAFQGTACHWEEMLRFLGILQDCPIKSGNCGRKHYEQALEAFWKWGLV